MQYLSSKGITLIETLITLTLVSILVLLVTPISNIIEKVELDYLQQKVYNSLLLAKSQAIKSKKIVGICPTSNGTHCDNQIFNWNSGWLMFLDLNDNQDLDTNERLIRVFDPVNSKFRIIWSQGGGSFFDPFGDPKSSGEFTICILGRSSTTIAKVSIERKTRIKKWSIRGGC